MADAITRAYRPQRIHEERAERTPQEGLVAEVHPQGAKGASGPVAVAWPRGELSFDLHRSCLRRGCERLAQHRHNADVVGQQEH